MAATSLLARLGLRVATLGSAASLAIAAPIAEGDVSQDAHTHAARTGVYFPTATRIGVVTNAVERMRFWNDGGISVGGAYAASPGAATIGLTSNGSVILGDQAGGAGTGRFYSYNTATNSANAEYFSARWSGNIFYLFNNYLASGNQRGLVIGRAINNADGTLTGVSIAMLSGTTESFKMEHAGNLSANILRLTATNFNASSGTQYGLLIDPGINQSGTAGYAVVRIAPTFTASGSGVQRALDVVGRANFESRINTDPIAWFGHVGNNGMKLGGVSQGVTFEVSSSVDTALVAGATLGVFHAQSTAITSAIEWGYGLSRQARLTTQAASGTVNACVGLGRDADGTDTTRTLVRVANRNPTATLTLSAGVNYFEVIDYDTTLSAKTDLLWVAADRGVYVGSRTGTATAAAGFDANGKLIQTAFAPGAATLTATYVGYGSATNALTGEAAFTYNESTDTLGVGTILTGDGSNTTPVYSFASDPDCGMYKIASNRIGLAVNGAAIVDVQTTNLTVYQPIRVAGGTATSPGYSFTGNTNTGVFRDTADTVGITAAGVERFSVSPTFVTSALRIRAINGAAGTPTYGFTADGDTGMYAIGSDNIGFSANGILALGVMDSTVTSYVTFRNIAGTAATPSYSYTSDPNTGSYSVGADTIGWSTNGVLRLSLSTTTLTSTLPLALPAGVVGAPSLYFDADTTTGFYRSGANEVSFAASGVQRVSMSATLVEVKGATVFQGAGGGEFYKSLGGSDGNAAVRTYGQFGGATNAFESASIWNKPSIQGISGAKTAVVALAGNRTQILTSSNFNSTQTITGLAGWYDKADLGIALGGSGVLTITNYYGGYIANLPALAANVTVTNQYGIYIDRPTRGSIRNDFINLAGVANNYWRVTSDGFVQHNIVSTGFAGNIYALDVEVYDGNALGIDVIAGSFYATGASGNTGDAIGVDVVSYKENPGGGVSIGIRSEATTDGGADAIAYDIAYAYSYQDVYGLRIRNVEQYGSAGGTAYGIRVEALLITNPATEMAWGIFVDSDPVYFGGAQNNAITRVSANTTLNATHYTIEVDASGGAVAITLPDSTGLGVNGRTYNIIKVDNSANAVNVNRSGGDTINGATTIAITVQYQSRTVQARAATPGYVII
jgi:hypothetical protein